MQRILIVEDDEAIAQLEKDYLEVNNYEVTVEDNGGVGLKRAIEGDYDLFILDLMLPEVDGFEVCKRIREVKNTPILLVSAKKDDIDKIRGLGMGADDYITKPFSPGELVARVKAHMSRFERLVGSNSPGKKNIIEIRGLRIDEDSRIVSVHGEDVQLSSKEF
ncbi:MAG TPA: DNA-binding response regulator, partial [Lachnospiraceae bacterium]|nr:DNA-binding response regulator [Lachnospiraceae bacterium]